jgi:hypothetical protein
MLILINPTITAYHNVKNLTITATTKAVENSNPCNAMSPAKLPSVTPIPPGDIEIAPKITDME